VSASKLRYAAYDAPRTAPRLKRTSQRSNSSISSHSTSFSDVNYERERGQSLDKLSGTVTAGDLALAAVNIGLDTFPKVSFSVH
jgi:hypothetical protein